jgi:hypothetical protein
MSCERVVFAAQASVESDYSISVRYVFSMRDHIFVFQASVFAAQVSVESVCGISMRYAL